jgi:hypothetical protein
MIDFSLQTILGLTRLLLLVFIIIMPLMIALELSRAFGLLKRLTKTLTPFTGKLGYHADSVYPLIAGFIFGISYGGGVLISEAKQGRIVGDQAFLIAVFLALCHAVVEDTLILVSQGAVWWIIVPVRLVIAILVTAMVAIILRRYRS